MRSLSRAQAVVLGLVLFAGTGLFVAGLFALGDKHWPWQDRYQLRVQFPQARGVELGTRVRVLGVEAGEVTRIDPPAQPGDGVMVTLQIANQWRDQQLIRSDASAQILSEGIVGGKVIEINPGTVKAEVAQANALLRSERTVELADALGEVNKLLQTIEKEKARVEELVDSANSMVRQGQGTMESIQGVSDAVKRAPIVRNYVEDVPALLIRPNCERNRWVMAESELFEPNRAQLTAQGREKLDDIAKRANELKHDGSEVVIAAYADPKTVNPAFATTLTRLQSEAVCGYLKDQHQVHKMGVFSKRDVRALGLGVKSPPPEPGQNEHLPPSRVEVIVFVPQK